MTKKNTNGILADEVALYDEEGEEYTDVNPLPVTTISSVLSTVLAAILVATLAVGATLLVIQANQTNSTQLTQITDGSTPAAVVQNIDSTTDLDGEHGLVSDSVLYARITDGMVKPVGLDSSTHALMIVDYEHHEIHSGDHFFICGYQSFTNAQVVDFSVITPATTEWTHMTFALEGESALSIGIYEGATVDTPGSAVIVYNNNRNSEHATTLTVRTGDTFTGEGTMIFSQYSGANKTIGNVQRDREIVLDQASTYIFRITNETSLANVINWCAEWYEHTNKD